MAVSEKTAIRVSGYALTEELGAGRKLDWDDFRVFTTVARVGSYTRAARELGLTQPAVSRRIARLEAAIGARLFDRTTRGTELTINGSRVLNYANAAELALVKAATVAHEASENVSGSCSLSVGDGLGAYWLPRFVTSFLAENPGIELQLFTTHDRAMNKRPLFDLQIQYVEPLEPEQVAVRLARLHFIMFASAEYLRMYGTPASLEDLSDHRVLDLTLALTDKGTLASWAGLANSASLFTNSNAALAESVRCGAGIALLPTYAAVVYPELIPIIPSVHFEAPVFVCYERDKRTNPSIRTTLNYLRSVVFDRANMPWFAEEFHMPTTRWSQFFQRSFAGASLGHSLKRSTMK